MPKHLTRRQIKAKEWAAKREEMDRYLQMKDWVENEFKEMGVVPTKEYDKNGDCFYNYKVDKATILEAREKNENKNPWISQVFVARKWRDPTALSEAFDFTVLNDERFLAIMSSSQTGEIKEK